jgi:hypothetical protein
MGRLRRSEVAGIGAALAAILLAASPVSAQAPAADGIDCTGLDIPENYRDYNWLTTISYGREGVLFRSSVDLSPIERYSMVDFHNIRRLVEALKARGTNLVVAVVPPRGLVLQGLLDPANPLHAAFDADGVRATFEANLELLGRAGAIVPQLLDSAMRHPDIHFFYPDDFHWTSDGARISAEEIGALVRAHPDYERLTPGEFAVEPLGERAWFGPYSEAVDDICGVRPAATPQRFYATREVTSGASASSQLLLDEPAEAASDEPASSQLLLDEPAEGSAEEGAASDESASSQLLLDEPAEGSAEEGAASGEPASSQLLLDEPAAGSPEDGAASLLAGASSDYVVLTGTSFSKRGDYDTNFGGFLKQAIGSVVDNRAVAGGSLSVALEGYLRSRDFADHPTPFLIWEIAPYYSLREPVFFRSAIAAAFGECAPEQALTTGESELANGQVTLISAPDGVSPDRSYLFMQVDDLSLVKFNLEIEDASGYVDQVEIERSTRVMNDGRFFLELLDLGAPVVEVRLLYQGDQRGRIASRICREPAEVAPLF